MNYANKYTTNVILKTIEIISWNRKCLCLSPQLTTGANTSGRLPVWPRESHLRLRCWSQLSCLKCSFSMYSSGIHCSSSLPRNRRRSIHRYTTKEERQYSHFLLRISSQFYFGTSNNITDIPFLHNLAYKILISIWHTKFLSDSLLRLTQQQNLFHLVSFAWLIRESRESGRTKKGGGGATEQTCNQDAIDPNCLV